MTAAQAAAVLAEIAMLLEVVGGDPFRARAYASAARRLEGSGADLERLARAGALTSIPGIGEGIAGIIEEMVRTGRSGLHQRLTAETPVGLYDLMRIKGLGTKRLRTLYAELGIDSLDALEEAAATGRIASLDGFGAKTQAKILEGAAYVRESYGKRRIDRALEVAERLVEHVRTLPGVSAAELAGELRRRMEIVSSIELVAATDRPGEVLAAFRTLGEHTAGAGEREGRAEVRFSDGFAARLACVAPSSFGAALAVWTGSEAHVQALAARAAEQGLALSADGLETVQTPTEQALYEALGLAWVPPELREGWGEVEAAAAGTLPRLVEPGDLRGTFHCHTTYSDGKATLAEMAEGARARGWRYLGIADHSQAASYAGGLTTSAVAKQQREIEAWNRAHGGAGKKRFRLFSGTEADILADGTLDYPDETLASFDYVVGSIHSAFQRGEREQTDRLIRAVRNPRLTILGHATGRLLLGRSGYPVDVRAVIDAAAEHGVAVEINADPARLDVDWRHARYAAERGVLVPINPDAHSVGGLDNVRWGVNVARKAWLGARGVLNTWLLEEVEDYFAQRKQARAP
jgi:DNA polymerase (family 10)